ncbi:MAG: VOC family protein, partial [Candidatus Dormibacteraeota bacterium]|nr:VOC family protein [Candidatus Dormibacteraeota bacterium]
AHQSEWREVLVKGGRNLTPVIDRYYFKSIYFREPGGVLFEIATDGPGFTVDETVESLGSSLSLPPWFNVRRDRLDVTLPPIVVPTTATTGAGH